MPNNTVEITWVDLRSQLMKNSRVQDLLSHLKSGNYVNAEETMLLNLFLQEAAHQSSEGLAIEAKENSEKYAKETIRISQSAAEFAETTSKSTHALKNATRWLAAATIVLAVSAVADIVIRVFCAQ